MQLIDVIILLLLGLGAIIGLKRGFIKQTVMSVGIIIVFILAFTLKNPVSIFLYERLPFFNFDGIFAGVTSLNILLYEIIAFLIVLTGLMIVFKIVIKVTSLIERFLDFTIFLSLPSKMLGAVMGMIEAYLWIFIALYILTLPFFNITLINESTFKDRILLHTPIISKYADQTVLVFNEIYGLKDEFADATDSNELNKRVLDVMLSHKIVTVESIEKLYNSGKLKITGINEIIEKHR